MERFHRYYRLHQVLAGARRPVTRQALETSLECSRATVVRVLDGLRAYGAPIEYVREHNGWRYASGSAFELPGLWFNPSELYALLAAQKLLLEVEPGLLSETLAPLRHKIDRILAAEHLGAGELPRRVRILSIARRGSPPCFGTAVTALLQRKRLRIEYHSRGRDQTTLREISPQRLVHYRDNWYFDAWCHMRKGLRSFALERIRHAKMQATTARNIADEALDRYFATAYGIFAGEPTVHAVLRFAPERARWVADERWHPAQIDERLDDGRLERSIPFADPRELIMDIMKFGPDVEVVAPIELRGEIARLHARAAGLYG